MDHWKWSRGKVFKIQQKEESKLGATSRNYVTARGGGGQRFCYISLHKKLTIWCIIDNH